MQLRVILALLFTFSCAQKPLPTGKVIIIKQWHPSPGVDTKNIQASRTLPQYQNQKEIYEYLSTRIKAHKSSLLIVEGCEAGKEIDHNFGATFNGWNMSSLGQTLADPNYDDIVTAVPLKLKAKYPGEVTALCADNEGLMTKNQLAVSDARGFVGFYLRLKQTASDPKKFATYKKALEETQNIEIPDPIGYSRSQTIKALENFNHYVQQRNALFVREIKKQIVKNPVLIVGGLHVKDLTRQLRADGIDFEVVTPTGYPESSEGLKEDLLKELDKRD